MLKPDIPENEEERLNEIEKYNLTEELTGENLESIVEIASQICNMPISLVSIIDKEKQFFKANKGLKADNTSRDLSFCGHAINKPSELMIVPDASKDDRFFDNPYVTESPFIRFYAGIPILGPNQLPLGTLCVIDYKANTLSEEQQNALRYLGEQITLIIELRKKNQLLKDAEKKIKMYANDMEDFAHIIAHDLKEPVRMTKSFLDLFVTKHGTELDVKGKKYIDFAQEGTVKINRLIDELLTFSKTARLSESFKPVDLNLLSDVVVKSLNHKQKESNATIKILNSLPTVTGIESAITQLFYNLIQNSLKFIPENRSPVISISSGETDKAFIVTIQDNGVGIPEHQLKNIFTIFRRVHTDNETTGTGVGLAIVKKIIEIHHGKIEVNSQDGVGSEFVVYFPKELTNIS